MDVSGQSGREGSARRSDAGAFFTFPPFVTGHRGPAVRRVAISSASLDPVPVFGQRPRCHQLRSASGRKAGLRVVATRAASLGAHSLSASVVPSQPQRSRVMSVPNQRLVPTQSAAQAHR